MIIITVSLSKMGSKKVRMLKKISTFKTVATTMIVISRIENVKIKKLNTQKHHDWKWKLPVLTFGKNQIFKRKEFQDKILSWADVLNKNMAKRNSNFDYIVVLI